MTISMIIHVSIVLTTGLNTHVPQLQTNYEIVSAKISLAINKDVCLCIIYQTLLVKRKTVQIWWHLGRRWVCSTGTGTNKRFQIH